MDRLLLKPSEVADQISVSRSKAYELIAAGEIPSIRVGGSVRVPAESLTAWVAARVKARAAEATKP